MDEAELRQRQEDEEIMLTHLILQAFPEMGVQEALRHAQARLRVDRAKGLAVRIIV